jgi:hypothetical protein
MLNVLLVLVIGPPDDYVPHYLRAVIPEAAQHASP